MKLIDLQKKVASFRDERDWRQYHNPKDLAQAISIEAAELLEITRAMVRFLVVVKW